jgi:hypothetical protein
VFGEHPVGDGRGGPTDREEPLLGGGGRGLVDERPLVGGDRHPSCHHRVRPDAYGPHASASVTIAPAPRAARAAAA